MNSALIVSNGEKSCCFFHDILSRAYVSDITTISNAGEARRFLIEKDYDLCIINAPLPDEFGENLAMYVAEHLQSEVIFVVKAEHFDEVAQRVEDYGVVTVSKPLNKTLFWNVLKMALAAHKKVKAMQREKDALVQKIQDIKIVDRAKCILISNLSMTESQAHRYIEKQAMDMRLSRREVAEEILKTYEY